MRILVVTNLYPPDMIGGYEVNCLEAVDALRALGHDVRVLTSVPRRPVPAVAHVTRTLKLTDVYDFYTRDRSKPVVLRLVDLESNFVSAHNVHDLGTFIEEFQPDVGYVWNLVGLGGLGLVACLQHLGVPWVWHLFDAVPMTLCEMNGVVSPVVAEEFSRQLSGHYLVCGQRVIDENHAKGVFLNHTAEVLQNWVPGTRPPTRTSYFTGGHLRVVNAGRINRDKGIDLVIEAAALLRRQGYANFSIDLYGDVSDPSLLGLVHERGLGACINFKGHIPPTELARLYAEYDIFAFPTWSREPFAGAPLEASGYGCVNLMSEDCGNSEWFVDGVHCLKAPRTAVGFADQLRAVLDSHVDLGSMGRRVQQVVWQDFSIDHVMQRVEQVLEGATRRSRPALGSAAEAYHVAMMAQKLLTVMVQEEHA